MTNSDDDAIKLWQLEEMQKEQYDFETAVFSQELDSDIFLTTALEITLSL